MSEVEADADADAGGGSDVGADPDPDPDPESASEPESTWRGRRFVLTIYVCIVLITGVFGYIIGLVRPENLDPRLFGTISLPPTPTGVAVYGMITVATMLGVLLYAVNYVSERFDDASVDAEPEPGPEEDR